ncbi:MAG: hypothetical protein LC104_16535 [Bacteroidales bacterium]|nr:hypothetical protein [Bacteroidales bacterium]
MGIVCERADDFVSPDEAPPQPNCTCCPGYAVRKDGTKVPHVRVDAFCPLHGYHYRRQIASAYNRSFNQRRYFSNFIIHLGAVEDPDLESWVKGYVRDLIRGYFDANAVIKAVVHPKAGDRHVHFGVASDVGHVTLAAILNKKSPRGRRPRLDLQRAWVDGYRKDQPWLWCAYTLRVDEGWRADEKVSRRLRRSWRSPAAKGQRIPAPRIIERVEPVRVVPQVASAKPSTVVDGLGWCLMPALRWRKRRWENALKTQVVASQPRISPSVHGIRQDDKVGAATTASRPRPQARPPPAIARPPPPRPCVRGHDVLDLLYSSAKGDPRRSAVVGHDVSHAGPIQGCGEDRVGVVIGEEHLVIRKVQRDTPKMPAGWGRE